ncbi:MAG TPA: ABC transporter substrate-binding protein [Burkholderiales bacterium]|nr:ABC transporter substrate-binding protein [Burkholderiales bacterium]
MNKSTLHGFSRREFLAGTSMLGAATLLGLPCTAGAEPPPETTRFRIAQGPFICYAPQMVAEELLRLEGFTDVQYVKVPPDNTYATLVASGGVDLAVFGPPSAVVAIDAGNPFVVLAGLHVGCWELFANERVRRIGDLKGKTIAVIGMGTVDQLWLASILSYVGMDPSKDVKWLPSQKLSETMRLFVEGKADAFLGFPPQPQELRARKFGAAIVNTTLDRPWSQYFCCMASMPTDFVVKYPIATKRALRALLKATDICATEPERVARYLVAKGYEPRYEIGLEVLKSLPYTRWREASAEDSLRFHALRLHEAGLIKSTPQQIVARGSNWRFLNELKKELKA